MRVSIFRTAAVAASFLPGVFAAAAVPQVDGVQSIADSLNASAQSLGLEINSIGMHSVPTWSTPLSPTLAFNL